MWIAGIHLFGLEDVSCYVNTCIAINGKKVHILSAEFGVINHQHLPYHRSPPDIKSCPAQVFFKWVVYVTDLLCQIPYSQNR
jgi:hypothetical protein